MASCNTRATFSPAVNTQSRVFVAEGCAGCGTPFDFYSCMRVDGLDKSFGDIESVYCPDPTKQGKFIEVGVIQGAETRWTADLVGRMPLQYQSILAKLGIRKCEFDLQVHFGRCNDPTDFNDFEFSLSFENVRITNYSTDPLGALSPDEAGLINETASISFENVYYIYKLYYGQVAQVEIAANIVNNSLQKIIICDDQQCGCSDCPDDEESDGCQKIFTLWDEGDGVDSVVLYSEDGGQTWEASTITGSGPVVAVPSDLICCGGRLYAITASPTTVEQLAIWSADIDDIFTGTETWVLEASDFGDGDQGIEAICLADEKIWFVAGDPVVTNLSHLYEFSISTGLVTELTNTGIDSPSAYRIHALDENNVILLSRFVDPNGDNLSNVHVTNNGGRSWQTLTILDNQGNQLAEILQDVYMKTDKEWFVTSAASNAIYCTRNAGRTWTQQNFDGGVRVIDFSNSLIGYVAVDDTLYRTYDGGNSWEEQPDVTGVSLQNSFADLGGNITRLTACCHDPNFVIGGNGNGLVTGAPISS